MSVSIAGLVLIKIIYVWGCSSTDSILICSVPDFSISPYKTALVIAMVMIMATLNLSALADPGAGDLSVNSTLTIDGLDEGDVVEYYQVLKWDPSADTTGSDGKPLGWTWNENCIDTNATGINDALLAKIAGVQDGKGIIEAADAGIIAAALIDNSAVGSDEVSGTTWTVNDVDPGLYVAIVTAKEPGTIYNPIFVAANFYGNGEAPDSANQIKVSADEMTYSDNAMAKKSKIPLEKTASNDEDDDNCSVDPSTYEGNGAYTADIGEEIDFVVDTTIPKFGSNYTNPVFKIVDTMNGINLDTTSIEVYTVDANGQESTNPLDNSGNAYYVISNASEAGYTLTFTKTYLQSTSFPEAGQQIRIKYTGSVNDDAEKVVNQKDNTVDLYFSTSPDDEDGKGLLRDQTNHFTFSLDANLLGSEYDNESSTEAIKIGVDKDGNPVVSMNNSYRFNGPTAHAALAGAEFELRDETGNKIATAVSDDTGRITFKGLDVGNYKLVETKAPNGYIKVQGEVDVVITANIVEDQTVEEELTAAGEKVEVTYKTNKLDSYSVTVGGSQTLYTIENSKVVKASSVKRDPKSSDKELANTKGVELPSTGGIGTTLFYVIGGILVIGAGILLVTKRRMNANN